MSKDKNEEKLNKLNEKLEEETAIQENELLIDFDEAIKENQLIEEKIKIKFKNKTYKVPAKMPFSFSMFFFRHCMQKVKGKQIIDVPDHLIAEYIKLQIGEEFLKAVEDSDVSFEFVMEKISTKILDRWGYGVDKKINQKKS